MKKQVFTVSALAAALTLSTGFNAFADGWVDENGRKAYVYDNGNRAGFGWFTDPATGLQYHLDYDGYAMTGTRVDGFWLDDQGVKKRPRQRLPRKMPEKKNWLPDPVLRRHRLVPRKLQHWPKLLALLPAPSVWFIRKNIKL